MKLMQANHHKYEAGNTLVVTISVVALILALLGSAVSFTEHVSRNSQRSRRTALAMEIADGHLEYLFTNWRNIYRTTWTTYGTATGGTDYSLLGTNYFYTDMFKPGYTNPYSSPNPNPSSTPSSCTSLACTTPSPVPSMTPAATPPIIPLPATSNFPTETNYTVTQYRVQAVDPMIDVDANENALAEQHFGQGDFAPLGTGAAPPAAYGPNTWQYSYFYLAAADVTVRAMTGNVTAKVRRVFEKRFDNPWTYAMFFVDDLELSPTASLSISGPIQTDGSLYISNNNFAATSSVGYGGQYVNGYSPNDTSSHTGGISAPNFPNNLPPAQTAPYLPFGWNVSMNATDANGNNDSYHELIEPPVSGATDPLSNVRLYNQAGIKVLIDSNNNITVYNASGTQVSNSSANTNDKAIYTTVTGALTTNVALWDQRENTYVRTANLDISKIQTAVDGGTISGFNGVLYVADTTTNGTSVTSKLGGTGNSYTTTERAIRLVNGTKLPAGRADHNNVAGLTVVSQNPVYVQGDYNTGATYTSATKTYNTPSDNGTYTSPNVTGYARKGASIMADAVTLLSGGWSDLNSNLVISNRVATNTTLNAAIVAGIVPSSNGNYSGGGENFVRLLEDWNKNGNTFTYYGSMVEMFASKQATGIWTGAGNTYKQPGLHWYYDDTNFSNQATQPPGNMQIAAYLQQQRWYQVY